MAKKTFFALTLTLAFAMGAAIMNQAPVFAAWGGGNGTCPAEDNDTVWYLGYNGPNNSTVYYRAEHRNPDHDVGTLCDYLSLGDGVSYWWYSHPLDGTTMDGSQAMPYGVEFGSGTWQLCLVFKGGGISPLENTSVQIRVYDVANQGDTTGTLLASYNSGMYS